MRGILLLPWVFIAPAPAPAEVRILASPGSGVGPYLKLFSVLRHSGQRVVIDGPCFCLHARAEHDPEQPDLRHPEGDPGLPRAALGSTGRVAICRPCGNARARRHLILPSVRAWIERHGDLTPEAGFPARPGAGGHVSALQLGWCGREDSNLHGLPR